MTTNRLRLPLRLTACLLFTLAATQTPSLRAAEAPSPIAEMSRLTTAGQFQQAFDLGTQNLTDW
ncbi:MAG: hypothetical protein RLZZ385_2034 [Pseudomonadota bacterium]|jgi:hypothetical protein